MSHFPYQFFDEYVFRTPLFSRKKFQEIAGNDQISIVELRSMYSDPVFQEAIYLASPYLYTKLKEWVDSGKELLLSEDQKLRNSLLKYYSRMSTRSIPFGLFTEVGLGKFSPILSKSNYDSVFRDTKLDMHFLVGLSNHFVKDPEIRRKILFYPNSSIYNVRNRIRYIEYDYTNGKRDYIISSAQLSNELKNVLDFSQQGKTIQQLSDILINEQITKEEAEGFIEEIINNHILVSELEPNVSENDFLDSIINILNQIKSEELERTLISIKNKLNEVDKKIGNSVSIYFEIEDLIKLLNAEYDQKYLFQTDLYCKDHIFLSTYWKKELKKAIRFLNRITISQQDTYLERFKKAFYERFENQEMPLAFVLDTEIGIGYRQDITTKNLHPYIDNLNFPTFQDKSNLKIELDFFQQILNEKIQENLLNNQNKIELSDEDFESCQENWDDMPDTISIIAEIISENNQEKLSINGGGGSSAANLLARFCSEKSDIHILTKEIAKKEEELNNDCILAEVIHLPEARIGNVIRRPMLRKYEIPFLAKSVLPKENQIPIDDLYISLKNDKIVLRSKKLNKEVKPYLTNSHNYSVNPLPVYHFLCDLYSQASPRGLYFNWGDLKNIYQFLPRVEYKNIILSKASWKIKEKEFTQFSIFRDNDIENKEGLLSEIRNWRNIRKIPQWVQWVQSDNKLTINLENYDLVKIFIDTIIKLKSIIIEEFLYNENDDFKREFIFPMYKVK
ncbi:lantibiotic dehydratase family protein [uncultured Chryseobacterium sp.]|uniref:lantibiotic dehydratase family protein n=1 Tax=uncultured Chryseobacterium sp. TaxID=259322 RepID=UPI0025F8BC36|nr:lantibiotic dehydratase family protein [uncultured Chryseobacterium sp.]